MKKRLFSILTILVLLVSAMPQGLAAGKLKTPSGLKWNGTVAEWKEVANAAYYSVNVFLDDRQAYFFFAEGPGVDCKEYMDILADQAEEKKGTLYFQFEVMAQPSDDSKYESSAWSKASKKTAYQYVPRKKLARPVKLKWDGTTAVWRAVKNAGSYSLTLYSDRGHQCSLSTEDAFVDLEDRMNLLARKAGVSKGEMSFYFEVRANPIDERKYVTGSWSNPSDPFTYPLSRKKTKLETPANPRWDGTAAVWDKVADTDHYSVTLEMDGRSRSLTAEKPGVELKDQMLAMAAAGGDAVLCFTFRARAHTEEYAQFLSGDASEPSAVLLMVYSVERGLLELPGAYADQVLELRAREEPVPDELLAQILAAAGKP